MAVAPPHATPIGAAAVRPEGATAPRRERPAWALTGVVVLCLAYAAFNDGATSLPEESWVQLAVAVIATAACAAWLYGNGIALRAGPLAWAGVGLLAGFALWTGVSIAWSVLPDASWIEVNRAIAYCLAAVLGLFIGSSLPRAPERVARAFGLLAVPVALYALGGKTLPGVHLGGIINLDHAGGFNRLKAPLEYWNALALFCVFGLLPMLRLASDPSRTLGRRVVSLLGVYLLVLVVTLTYSRGGFVAMLAGLAVFLWLTTERVRTATYLLAALWAASIPLAVALTRTDLTTDQLPLARREDDALAVLITFVVCGALLAVFGLVAQRVERSRRFTPARARTIGRPAMVVAAGVVALSLISSVASGRLADAFDSFKDTTEATGRTDPNRLLSANSGNRWTWWKEAAGAWSDRPVVGWGAGSFPLTHKLYRRDLLTVKQPHSVPLQWLAETGLVGFLLAAAGVLALLAAALARVRQLPWAVAGAPPARGYAASLWAIGVAWIAHSVYDWDWDIPAITLPMLVALGVLAARPAVPRLVEGRGAALTAAVVACVLVGVSALLPAIARTRTDSALEAIGRPRVSDTELASAASDAELAAQLNPLAVEPLFAASTIAQRRDRRDDARREILRALERQPDNVDAWVRLAQFEFERGDRAGVRRASDRALELDPRNPGLIVLARRAWQNSAPPNESATATGSPLPTQIPITEPDPVGAITP